MTRKEEIALGALLHDAGKFLQRANPPGEGLSEQSERLKAMACPSRHGAYSHLHVAYTNEFVSALPFWPDGVEPSRVANLAVYHHRPQDEDQRIIADADRLSSAMEREPDEDRAAGGSRRFRRVPLLSVASTVLADDSETPPAHLAVTPLSPRAAFPKPDGPPAADLTADYAHLWEAFLNEWGDNRCPRPLDFINRACSVLERYTWCIPSATNVVPDISLFDHLKTSAAIAVCLWETRSGEPSEKPFLLVAGDLSGIQNYIFGFQAGLGGLARRLRARSFQIEVFSEAISLHILRRLSLPIFHRILFAGGKFELLLPNTRQVRQVLSAVQEEASRWLFDRSVGEMTLSLASVPLAPDDLGDFAEASRRVGEALREEKNRAGHTLLVEDGRWAEDRFVLPALEVGRQEAICRCCGRRKGALTEDGAALCGVCESDARLGQHLPRAELAVFYDDRSGSYRAPLGTYSLASSSEGLPTPPLMAINMDAEPGETGRVPVLARLKARYVPRHPDGSIVTFQELAEKATGRAALGFLKLDVDNLGYLFARGLRGATRDRTSISRVAALSRTLDLFFEGYVETLLREDFPETYVVYSGGDDLLAVAPWDIALDLAARLRADFRRFTAGNPAWTLSGGMALVGYHTPVLDAVREADAHLEASKSLPGRGVLPWPLPEPPEGRPLKDRFTALGTSLPWETYPDILDAAKTLLGWLRDETVTAGCVRRLLRYSGMYREFQRTGRTPHLRYAPLLAYDLRRNWPERTPAQRRAREWAAALAAPDSEQMKALHFICQYALNGIRTGDTHG